MIMIFIYIHDVKMFVIETLTKYHIADYTCDYPESNYHFGMNTIHLSCS